MPVCQVPSEAEHFSGKRSEFYSVINSKCLTLKDRKKVTFKPSHVLLCIDDIYDMHHRLPNLYSTDQIESLLKRIQRDMDIDLSTLSKEELASLNQGGQIRHLLHLLSWRQLESIIAENLALQLDAKFLVWAVKQLSETINLWFASGNTPVYLSHPITDARKEKNETSDWPKFTEEINMMQSLLSELDITLIMPTGIDELRFEIKDKKYTGRLLARWPLILNDINNLLYSLPKNISDIEYETFLLPKYWNFEHQKLSDLNPDTCSESLRCEISAILQVFVRGIEAQIAARDFLFIYHSDGVLVYRPYYSRKPRPIFSGGVDAEVRLWEDIVQLNEKKRIAFVHYTEDITAMLSAKRYTLWAECVDAFWGVLNSKYTIDRDTAENMLQNKGRINVVQEILNQSNIATGDRRKIQKSFPDDWRNAKIVLLKKLLTDALDEEIDEKLIGIWIFRDFNAAKTEFCKISDFLKSGIPIGNGWETQIDSIFPDKHATSNKK